MNLYPQNRTDQSSKRRLLLVSLLVVLVFLADAFTGQHVRSAVREAVGYTWQGSASVTRAVGESGFFSSKRGLEMKMRALTEEIERLKEQNGQNQVLQEENERLQEMVKVAEAAPGITAPVISSFRSSLYGTFIVGAGSADGIAQGDLVLSPGGFVLGKISDVGPHSSLVAEVFAPNSSIDGIISGSSLIVEGRGAGNARARLPHGISTKVGDPVTAPGTGGRAIGIVGAVDSDNSTAYSDVYIGLPVSLESLRYVYIEK